MLSRKLEKPLRYPLLTEIPLTANHVFIKQLPPEKRNAMIEIQAKVEMTNLILDQIWFTLGVLPPLMLLLRGHARHYPKKCFLCTDPFCTPAQEVRAFITPTLQMRDFRIGEDEVLSKFTHLEILNPTICLQIYHFKLTKINRLFRPVPFF